MGDSDRTMEQLRDLKNHIRMGEERRGGKAGEVHGWDSEAPAGHSIWDGEQWYPVPDLTPLQVLRALIQDPDQENLETARWYAWEWRHRE